MIRRKNRPLYICDPLKAYTSLKNGTLYKLVQHDVPLYMTTEKKYAIRKFGEPVEIVVRMEESDFYDRADADQG